MFLKYGELRPLGPGLIILLMALLLIWTAYRKAREATAGPIQALRSSGTGINAFATRCEPIRFMVILDYGAGLPKGIIPANRCNST